MEAVLTKPVILYAEDDLDDFETMQEALEHETDKYALLHARNGLDVKSYLEDLPEDKYPTLIVLDLNMPVMDGKETLRWLKQDHRFRHIPIMVFTTSSRTDDLNLCKAYECTFFRKPTLYRDLLHIVQKMLQMSLSHK